jgi:hypothetical protein
VSLTGCSLFDDNHNRSDPLLNIPRRAADDRRSGNLTSYPGDSRTAAGLASGQSGLGIPDRNSDDNRDRDRVSPATGWSGNDSASGNGGARLATPTANNRSDDQPSRSSPAGVSNGMAVRIRSFEDAQQFLIAHGVRWQRLEQRDGEWSFECTVPTRSGSSSMRTYEARDKYGLLAIQKVIDNITKDQGR